MAKHKSKSPRRKRMNRKQRLQAAKNWIPTYQGKNIVHGYKNWFGTSLLCAALELKQLGIAVDESYIAQLRQTELSYAEARRKKREERKATEIFEQDPDSDENFAFIAGYTSAGFPYGVTWEEMGEIPPWQREEEDSPAAARLLPSRFTTDEKLPFSTRKVPGSREAIEEYLIPEDLRWDVLDRLEVFSHTPPLDYECFDLRAEKTFRLGDYRIIRQHEMNLVVSPYSNASVFDWLLLEDLPPDFDDPFANDPVDDELPAPAPPILPPDLFDPFGEDS